MADLSRSQGKTGQALDCLKLAVQRHKEGRVDTDILPAMDAVVDLQEERGASESALHWELRALTVARKLAAKARIINYDTEEFFGFDGGIIIC